MELGSRKRKIELVINYVPHDGQKGFHESKTRFRILACGRRFGKTIAGSIEAVKKSTDKKTEGFIVAPTMWHTEQAWNCIIHYLPRQVIKQIWRTPGERRIELINGSVIWAKSADNPDSLRSKGLDWVWIDEAGLVSEEAWNYLRPALMDRQGIAWFTSTPKGHNLFFKLWQRGQDSEQTDYKSWSFASSTNPFLDPREIQSFRRDMPSNVFEQEINAAFLENVGTVFRNVTSHVQKEIKPFNPNESVVVGCDLAKHQDFTVVAALASDGRLVGFDRWQQLDWHFQRQKICAFCLAHNEAALLIDSTGIGDPIFDELVREYRRVDGFKITQASKKELIENLSMMLDNNEIVLSDNPVLISELQLFAYEMTASGQPKYGAPEGYHDDCCVALALAAWQLKREPRGEIEISFAEVKK